MSQAMSTLANPEAGYRVSRFIMGSSTAAILFWAYLVMKRRQRKRASVIFQDRKKSDRRRSKKADLGQTLRQLRIIMGSILGFKEILLATGMTLGLILRTMCDMWQIYNGTEIESAIITANVKRLRYTILSFFVSMPTFAFVNNIIRYFADELRLHLRYNLSKILYDKYMTDMTFYQLTSASGATSNEADFHNVDQLLTADVDKFCGSVVELYNNMSKPLLDITLLVHRMTTTYTGGATPAIMIAWLACAGAILTGARRPQTGYIISETQSEGQLRFVHSRLIQNNEEVAFYRGNNKERDTLMHALEDLKEAVDAHTLFKFKINFLDNIVGRYFSTVVGYISLALPFFSTRYALHTNEDRLEYYYKSGRMMMKLAESITRVIMAGQGLSKMAAYTERVRALMDTVESFNQRPTSQQSATNQRGLNSLGRAVKEGKQDYKKNSSTIGEGGQVELCDPDNPIIEFLNVTLSTPNGDVLLRDLTFTIRSGQNVIISGPNGSGKSSLFRVLGNLWRVPSGKLTRPDPKQLFYICQKPYMTLGTFRDQIIYPDRQEDMIKKLRTDSQLVEILKTVELHYLLEREHRLDSINDWQEVLSGGEKQRMALARLIYHRPQFAILDECTSAVAIDVEQKIYRYLSEEINCTLLSVTHRVKQLAKFHQFVLNFDGNGDYEFKHLLATLDDDTDWQGN